MRVVVDANVVVSAYLAPSGPPATVLRSWEREEFELLVSEPILAEYHRVLRRPRIVARHGLSDAEIAAIVGNIRTLATMVQVTSQLNVIQADPTDNKLLECAVDGSAEIIVSGDKHLRALGTYQGIQITTPHVFATYLVL